MEGNRNTQVGQELIIQGREVFTKEGHKRLGWLKDYPQSGGNAGTTSMLDGPELIVKGRQVFDVKDQSKPIGFLSDESAVGASGYTGSQQSTQQQNR